MSWFMRDDLSGDVITDPSTSSQVTVLLDDDPLAAFDIDPEHYTREALLVALGERLVDHDVAPPADTSTGPRRVLVGAGDTVLVRQTSDGTADGDVVREWLVGPGAIEYAETIGITIDPDPSPAVPPGGGEADAPAPDPAGEGRAPEAATNGHRLAAVQPIGDGTRPATEPDGGEGNGVGPAGSDEAPIATPPRESDALTRAEDLLEQKWTPKKIAEHLGLELSEVRDLERALRGPKGSKK